MTDRVNHREHADAERDLTISTKPASGERARHVRPKERTRAMFLENSPPQEALRCGP